MSKSSGSWPWQGRHAINVKSKRPRTSRNQADGLAVRVLAWAMDVGCWTGRLCRLEAAAAGLLPPSRWTNGTDGRPAPREIEYILMATSSLRDQPHCPAPPPSILLTELPVVMGISVFLLTKFFFFSTIFSAPDQTAIPKKKVAGRLTKWPVSNWALHTWSI